MAWVAGLPEFGHGFGDLTVATFFGGLGRRFSVARFVKSRAAAWLFAVLFLCGLLCRSYGSGGRGEFVLASPRARCRVHVKDGCREGVKTGGSSFFC